MAELNQVEEQLTGRDFIVDRTNAELTAMSENEEKTFTAQELGIFDFIKLPAGVEAKFMVSKDAFGNFSVRAILTKGLATNVVSGINIVSLEPETSTQPMKDIYMTELTQPVSYIQSHPTPDFTVGLPILAQV